MALLMEISDLQVGKYRMTFKIVRSVLQTTIQASTTMPSVGLFQKVQDRSPGGRRKGTKSEDDGRLLPVIHEPSQSSRRGVLGAR